MGGVAGHLSHLQENLDFTFGDIKAVLQDVASGEMEAVEKVDGQNIFFTYDVNTGTVKTARNSGDIKRGGMSPEELTAKFAGHPAEGAFIGGFKAIESALQGLSEEELVDIFGEEADTYVNVEIMYPANPNIINYNGNYIVMHGAQYFGDDPDAEPTNTKNSFAKLLNAIESAEKQGDKNDWQVMGPQIVALQNIMDGSAYGDFVAALDTAAPGSSDGMTLGEYVKERLYEGPVGRLPISQHQQDELVKLIMGDEDAPTLRQFKKGMPKDLHKLISQLATKANRYKVISTMLLPIERVISDFAIEVLRGMGSLFVSDHDTEIQRMRKEVESSIAAIQSAQGSDIEVLQSALDKQLAKLGPIENIASTMEGIVFEYPPGSEQLYKLTGAFAMVNQIIGGARRMPKKEDMDEGLLREFIKTFRFLNEDEGHLITQGGLRRLVKECMQSLIVETGARGFAYEALLIAALDICSENITVVPPAGNDTTVSDLGFAVCGVSVAAEVKLSSTDLLGSFKKSAFASLTWDGSAFNGAVNEEHPLADTAILILRALKASKSAISVMRGLDPLKPYKPLPWNLLGGRGSGATFGYSPGDADVRISQGEDIPNDDKYIVYALIRNEEERFPLPELDSRGNRVSSMRIAKKQLTSGAEITISPKAIARLISSKPGPNGAHTSYIIVGDDNESSVSGQIFSLGADPLALGAPPFNGIAAIELRFRGGGGKKGRNYGFDLGTKAAPGKGPTGGLRFNSAQELCGILLGSPLCKKRARRSRKKS